MVSHTFLSIDVSHVLLFSEKTRKKISPKELIHLLRQLNIGAVRGRPVDRVVKQQRCILVHHPVRLPM